ncbi:MAG TPA: CCA tRNA nucleotidyltransferase [Syntrophomonas sp.]|nr:CCA tRNA nucleotidyltransferase [Syntrophomonas sp.]HRW11499.1 CCA tRNA nucleotidyltransferase [Syntrophomonas sp.]
MKDWPEYIRFIFDKLLAHGYEVFAVGGCVRDMIAGIKPQDYDMVCSASLEQISQIFSRTLTVGARYGTVIVLIDRHPVELSTYRKVELNQKVTALEMDLAGRDFSINAMAMDVNGIIYDPWGGQADLKAGLIRATGDRAEVLFADDPLRMMRAIRFSVTYDYQIAESTCAALLKLNHLLAGIAWERIREELNRILTSDRPAQGIRKLQTGGLMAYIIPELEVMVGFDQRNFRHNKDLFEHSLAVLEGVPGQIDVRLAALLHDIGKPACFTIDENGVGHFYNHHQAGMEMTRRILERLKYDQQTITNVSLLVGSHMTRYAKLRNSSLKQLIKQVGEDKLDSLYTLQRADIMASAPPFDFSELDKMQQAIDFILDTNQPLSIKDLAVSGTDLLTIGYAPGPFLGETLQRLLEFVLEDPSQNQRELLLHMASVWKDQQL